MNEAAKGVVETTREAFAEEGVGSEPRRYAHNVLEGFGNGCLLDLRVRWAMELLKSPMMQTLPGEGGWTAMEISGYALDVATELLALAELRGLVEPLPGDDGLDLQVRLQATRTARYGVLQQMSQGKVAQEEGSRIQPATGPLGRTLNG